MINHDRIFNFDFRMRKNNWTFFTYDFWCFFYDNCSFEKLFSMQRFFFEISAYLFFHFLRFFLVVIKSFTRHSSNDKIVFLCHFENETFYKLTRCFEFYRERYFNFRQFNLRYDFFAFWRIDFRFFFFFFFCFCFYFYFCFFFFFFCFCFCFFFYLFFCFSFFLLRLFLHNFRLFF